MADSVNQTPNNSNNTEALEELKSAFAAMFAEMGNSWADLKTTLEQVNKTFAQANRIRAKINKSVNPKAPAAVDAKLREASEKDAKKAEFAVGNGAEGVATSLNRLTGTLNSATNRIGKTFESFFRTIMSPQHYSRVMHNYKEYEQIAHTNKGFREGYRALSNMAAHNAVTGRFGVDNVFWGLRSAATRGISALTPAGQAAGWGTKFVGGALGMGVGLAGGALLAGLAMAANQLVLALKENIKAITGGNYANSRVMEANIGNWMMHERHSINAASYGLIRTRMRLMGARSDDEIAAAGNEAMRMGIYGRNGTDAFNAMLSRQAIKTQYGFDFGAEAMGRLYRATQASGPSSIMRTSTDTFTLSKLMLSLSEASRASRTESGAFASVQELNTVVQSLTENLLGMDNNVESLVNATAKFGRVLSQNQATASEVIGLFKSANAMSFSQRLNVLAYANTGSGNILAESERMLKRSRNAAGIVSNAQLQARAALKLYERIGGGEDTDEARAKFRQVLGQMNLQGLESHPELINLLRSAASGNSAALTEFVNKTESNREILQKQANLLDAIRNPMEHIRDLMFGKMSGSIIELASKATKSLAEYEGYKSGLRGDNLEKYVEARSQAEEQNSAKLADGLVSNFLSALKENVTGEISPDMKRLIGLLENISSDIKKDNREVVGGSY